jgi:hypothetical protein
LAVTVVLADNVTLQVVVLEVVQPVQEENVLLPADEGAESTIFVPELAVMAKLVVPVVIAVLPFSV